MSNQPTPRLTTEHPDTVAFNKAALAYFEASAIEQAGGEVVFLESDHVFDPEWASKLS